MKLHTILNTFLLAFVTALLILPNAHAIPSPYSINFQVADPDHYNRVKPSQMSCPTPSGGTASNPMLGADFASSLNSLSSKKLGLGQIVPFEVKIKVDGDTSAENGSINSTFQWNTKTSSNKNFGYDPAFGVYCAFIDTADSSSVGLDGNENVSFSSSTTGGGDIQGDFSISGLNDGDTVVLEIWVVLKSQVPNDVNGTVHASIVSAETSIGGNINTGNQTIPLNQVQEFFSSTADVKVQKVDAPDPVDALGTLTYILSISNASPDTVANGVVLTDVLDPNTQFVSIGFSDQEGSQTTCSHSGEPAGGTLTCIAGYLEPLEAVKFKLTVSVLPSAPNGPGGAAPCTGAESLCNNASVAVINDGDTSNNSISQPTGVSAPVSHSALFVDKVPDVTAIRGSGQVIYSYAVNALFASSLDKVFGLQASDDKCTPVTYVNGDTNNDGFLNPSETWNYQCITTLTETTTNVVTVTGGDFQTGVPVSSTDSATVTVINPSMSLQKTADQTTVTPGTEVTYSFEVTNTGDDAISAVTINDPNCTPIVFDSEISGDGDSVFEPSEIWNFTCSKILNETTINTATAEGTDSLGGEVSSAESSVEVTVVDPPTPTPTETATPEITASPTPTETATPEITVSPTPTDTATPEITASPTPTDTATPEITETATATPTFTPCEGEGCGCQGEGCEPTATPTPTFTPCEGEQCGCEGEQCEPTPTPTFTPCEGEQCGCEGEQCESTPTPTPTDTPTEVPSNTPTATPTIGTLQDFGCSDTNIKALQFKLDGTSNRQLTLINRIGGKIRSLKAASASTKKSVLAAMQASKILQEQNWIVTWSIPSVVTQCTNSNALVCVTTSNVSKLNQYRDNALTLKTTGLKLAGILKRFGKVNALLAKQYLKSVPAEHEKALSFVSQIPETSTKCG